MAGAAKSAEGAQEAPLVLELELASRRAVRSAVIEAEERRGRQGQEVFQMIPGEGSGAGRGREFAKVGRRVELAACSAEMGTVYIEHRTAEQTAGEEAGPVHGRNDFGAARAVAGRNLAQ